MTPDDIVPYLGKLCDLTWTLTPGQQQWYGCVEGSALALLTRIDGEYVISDEGIGFRISALTSIAECDATSRM